MKTGAKYVWHITQEGAARGHALLGAITSMHPIKDKPFFYSIVGTHAFLSFAKRFWKNNTSTVMRTLATGARYLQGSTKQIPLLMAVATTVGFVDPTSLAVLFATSAGMTLTNYILKKLRKRSEACLQSKDCTTKTIDVSSVDVFEPLVNVLARAGQGAFFQEVLADYISIVSEEAATTNWLMLFTFVPALLEIVRIGLLRKAMHDKAYQNKTLANFSAAVVGVGSAQETLGYNVFFIGEFLSLYADQTPGVITNEQALVLLPIAQVLAIISGASSVIHHKNKLAVEWNKHEITTNPRQVEMLALPLSSHSSTGLVLQALNGYPSKSNRYNGVDHNLDDLRVRLLDEEKLETGSSSRVSESMHSYHPH